MAGVTLQLTGRVDDRDAFVKARTIGHPDADGFVPIEITTADAAVGTTKDGVPDTVRLYDWVGRRGRVPADATSIDQIEWAA